MGNLLEEGMTLGNYLKTTIPVEARCNTCGLTKRVDIAALATKVGEDYVLFNRRSRCKQPGCDGWVRFFTARGGVFLPHWDERAVDRWMRKDRG